MISIGCRAFPQVRICTRRVRWLPTPAGPRGNFIISWASLPARPLDVLDPDRTLDDLQRLTETTGHERSTGKRESEAGGSGETAAVLADDGWAAAVDYQDARTAALLGFIGSLKSFCQATRICVAPDSLVARHHAVAGVDAVHFSG